MADALTFNVDRRFVSTGRLEEQDADYHKDCATLTPVERLAVVQYLRERYWGDEAFSTRIRSGKAGQRSDRGRSMS